MFESSIGTPNCSGSTVVDAAAESTSTGTDHSSKRSRRGEPLVPVLAPTSRAAPLSLVAAQVQLKEALPTPLTDIGGMDSATFVYEVVSRGINIDQTAHDPFGDAAYSRAGVDSRNKSGKKTDRSKARARFKKVFNGVYRVTAAEKQKFLRHSQLPSRANLKERDKFLCETLEVTKQGIDRIITDRLHFWNAGKANQRTKAKTPRTVGKMASFMEKTEVQFSRQQSNLGNLANFGFSKKENAKAPS